MRGRFSLLLVSSLISHATVASPQDDTFFRKAEEGWFFYEPLPTDPPEPEVLPPKPTVPDSTPAPTQPTSAPSSTPPLSVEWLRANFQVYLDRAIDDPSPDNVRAALYLQRAIMDKSTAFSDAAQRVVIGDPYLDEISRRPLATFAANKANRIAKEEQRALLARLSQEVGLYFFYSSTCKFCIAQAPVLKALERRHGMKVLPVSLDGMPLPTGDYPDFQIDRGQAQMLGVVQTPALFLVKPELGFPDGFIPIAQGAISMEDAENRIVLSATNAGWMDEADYNKTRPVDKTTTLAGNLDGITEADVQDPTRLVEVLRQRLKGENK